MNEAPWLGRLARLLWCDEPYGSTCESAMPRRVAMATIEVLVPRFLLACSPMAQQNTSIAEELRYVNEY